MNAHLIKNVERKNDFTQKNTLTNKVNDQAGWFRYFLSI